jgi:glutamyl-Q tRNA(Asp) synthetase
VSYRGRFAPSPTGPLHLGSLIAALASYLDARHAQGCWLVRMDDLDPPREEAGAAQRILKSLQIHGLHWDETVLYQSSRDAAYQRALDALDDMGALFYCECSRAMQGPEGICCGTCGYRQEWVTPPCSIRVRVPPDTDIRFSDRVQGLQHSELGATCADFIVRRKDGLNAYQLAVVVDDAAQGITHIVRGSDLLDTTARQIYLQQRLSHPTPQYCHVPVITTSNGDKFSKQSHAPALDDTRPTANLRYALRFLNQPEPPAHLDTPAAIVAFAVEAWSIDAIPRVMAIAANSLRA